MGKNLFHSWGPWESDGRQCVKFRRCTKKCPKCYEEIVEHNFGEWSYIDAASCAQIRKCVRCGHEETRLAPHTFGEWAYVQSDSCRQFRSCSHCKTTEYRDAEHSFGDWHYHTKGSCEMTRICSHCGEQEFQIRHTPQNTVGLDSACEIDTNCSVCGERISSKMKHTWSEQILPYKECLDNAIAYHREKEQRLTELISEYEVNPLSAQLPRLKISKLHSEMSIIRYQNIRISARENEIATCCTVCREPRYLGIAERRIKQSRGFLSYCSANSNYADKIDQALRDSGNLIMRDIRDVDVGTKIHAFMDRIESVEYVILLISDNYLRSKYCMYEATKAILSLLKNNCKIIPIALDIDLGSKEVCDEYIRYWKQMSETASTDPLLVADEMLYKNILDSITEFFKVMTERKYLSSTLSEPDSVLLSRIVAAINEKR